MVVVTRDPDYLMHHGIKGQKWGVRRFQNPDGSLTTAGTKRYHNRDMYDSMKEMQNQGKITKKEFRSGVKELDKMEREDQKEVRKEGGQYGLTIKQQKALKTGAIVAGSLLAAYGAHKLLNDPKVISAGKDIVTKARDKITENASNISEKVKSTTEYKIAKRAGGLAKTAGKSAKGAINKTIDYLGSDKVLKAATTVGTVSGLAALMKTKVGSIKEIMGSDKSGLDKAISLGSEFAKTGKTANEIAKGNVNAATSSNGQNKQASSGQQSQNTQQQNSNKYAGRTIYSYRGREIVLKRKLDDNEKQALKQYLADYPDMTLDQALREAELIDDELTKERNKV